MSDTVTDPQTQNPLQPAEETSNEPNNIAKSKEEQPTIETLMKDLKI